MTQLSFASINDALIHTDRTNNITKVSFKDVYQEEYAFSETTLISIEKIKFIDGEHNILTYNPLEISLSSNEIIEGENGVASIKFIITTFV